MLKILIAPTAFKQTMSPCAVANAIVCGLNNSQSQFPDRTIQGTLVPLADGGDGTVEAVHLAAGGRIRTCAVVPHDGMSAKAHWLELGEEALIELASACGLATFGSLRAPLEANTAAVGQLIAKAAEKGCSTINVAVGGSASTDAGTGALQALGARFYDSSGNELRKMNGGVLSKVKRCDLSALQRFRAITFRVLTDVENPLFGSHGAAEVFAPQKGATAEEVRLLDAGLRTVSIVLEHACGRKLSDSPGSGAAGGTAFGLACALGARMQSGFQWVEQACGLKGKLAAADLVITGEGRLDSQSVRGKVIGELIKLCRIHGKKLWVVAGSVEPEQTFEGVDKVIVPERVDDDSFCTASDIARAVERTIAMVSLD